MRGGIQELQAGSLEGCCPTREVEMNEKAAYEHEEVHRSIHAGRIELCHVFCFINSEPFLSAAAP